MVDFVKSKFTINNSDPDISPDCISTIVSLRENGIPDAKLVANNEKGKMYLTTINMGDVVEVSYCYTDDDTEIWDVVFKGEVYELAPTFTKIGEICEVVAYGKGYPLKIMRVAEEYGIQGRTNIFDSVSVSDIYPVKSFSLIKLPVNGKESGLSEWGKYGNSPWLDSDDGDSNYIYGIDVSDIEENFTFTDLPSGYSGSLNSILYMKIKNEKIAGSGGYNEVTLYVDVGSEYVLVGSINLQPSATSYDRYGIGVSSILNSVTKINNCKLKIVYTGHGDGSNYSEVRITYAWLQVGYGTEEWDHVGNYPWLNEWDDGNYIATGIQGEVDVDYKFEPIPFQEKTIIEDLKLQLVAKNELGYPLSSHIRCYIWFNGTWYDLGTQVLNQSSWGIAEWNIFPEPYSTLTPEQVNNLKLKIKLEDTVAGEVRITQARLNITAITGSGCTLKNIVVNSSKGIIPNYVQKIFGGASSGHTINTDYIENYSDEFNYVLFPFESAFDSLQELIKLVSAMEAIKDRDNKFKTWKGLHWITTPDNKVIVAPVGDHSYAGTRPDIEAVWNTRPLLNPIVVKQDMIVEMFKKEAHQANYVLVAGKYCLPLSDLWCEPLGFNDWKQTDFEGISSIDGSSFSIDYNTSAKGDASLRFHHWNSGGGAASRHIYRPLVLDITKLIGLQTNAVICLQAKKSVGDPSTVKVRLYTSSSPPHHDDGDYFEAEITSFIESGKWSIIEIPITSTDISNVEENAVWSKHGNPSWSNIKQIAIQFYHSGGVPWEYVVHIDDLHIVGDTIRAAYDSTKINDPKIGCRMITIKNSLAQTDTLNPNDDNSPLAQTALYELLRARVDILSGSIQIPLTPQLKAGQIVHILSNQKENGSYNIDQEFRIIELEHRFDKNGAFSILKLSSDLQNSITFKIVDPYDIVMRAVSPDFQTKTYASVRSEGAFDIGLTVIAKDYPT